MGVLNNCTRAGASGKKTAKLPDGEWWKQRVSFKLNLQTKLECVQGRLLLRKKSNKTNVGIHESTFYKIEVIEHFE